MTTRSACEAVGVDADAALKEIKQSFQKTQQLRKKVGMQGRRAAKINPPVVERRKMVRGRARGVFKSCATYRDPDRYRGRDRHGWWRWDR
jgi:hypothetical protein